MKRMKSATQAGVKRLRRVLLTLLLVALAGLTALFLLGRQGAPDDDSTGSGAGADPANSANPADTDGRPAKDEENVVASSDAFDFTQSIEGKPVFKVHGDRFRTTRDGKVELEGVNFEIFRDSTSYSVASDTRPTTRTRRRRC